MSLDRPSPPPRGQPSPPPRGIAQGVPRPALPATLLAMLAVWLPVPLLAAAGAGQLLYLLFPVLGVIAGLVCHQLSPQRAYLQLVVQIWLLAPFVRRLVDWQIGRVDQSIVLLTPLAVSLIALICLFNRFPRDTGPLFMMMIALVSVVLYGFVLGVLNNGAFGATYALLTWLAPLALGLHILALPAAAVETAREAVLGSVMWLGLGIACYGVYQYFVLPPWDAAWMLAADMNSIGRAEPQAVRIFGTLNSPGPYAMTLMTALLILFDRARGSQLVGTVPMVIALGLSLVRSAWGGLVLALGLMLVFGRVRMKARVAWVTGLASLAAVPLLLTTQFGQRIVLRMATLTDLEGDTSFRARLDFTMSILSDPVRLVLGSGLGAEGLAAKLADGSGQTIEVFDNGILALIFTFGSVSLVLFAIFAIWTVILIRSIAASRRTALHATLAVALMSQLVFTNILTGAAGALLFLMLFLALRGITWERP